jgi:LAO/AO transport system kinase
MHTQHTHLSIREPRKLARMLSLVENNLPDGIQYLKSINISSKIPLIGITGPPGAGKSSIVNALISHLVKLDLKIGILAVDPTSPFNFGSLLGDRIRMSEHFNHPNVFIRSIATRGSLGGVSAKIYEMTDVMKSADFDVIFVETVGVGQSEVEIAGLADSTVVVLVPEAGDEVQTLKSGLMEIADLFVVNKADRDGADVFIKNLNALVHQHPKSVWNIPVLKTIATTNSGIDELWQALSQHHALNLVSDRKWQLMTDKAFHLILNERMKDIDKYKLNQQLIEESNKSDFNLYQFIDKYYKK